MALERAFPSAPQRPGSIAINVTRKHPDNKWNTFVFSATYAARKFLDLLLQDATYKWVSDNEIEMHSHGDWIIHTPNSKTGLNDIMDHTYSREEQDWSLPTPYPNQCAQLRGENYYNAKSISDVTDAPGAPKAGTDSLKVKKRAPAPAPDSPGSKPEPKPKRLKSSPSSKEGKVTLADIATEMGIEPKAARDIMRKAKVPKPAGGWIFEDSQIKDIERVLKTGRK